MKSKKLSALIVFLIILAGLVYLFGINDNKTKKGLRVYVPCGMTLPFQELAKTYESYHPDIKVESSFDNTNVLVKLILNKGETPDVFVSPGEKEINLLREKGVIAAGSQKTFGRYELILIAPKKSPDLNQLGDLLKESVKIIGIANPDFNSVGAYAVEALKSLGYWEKIKDKILFTDTPIETLSYVAASKVNAAIHYNNCPFETNSGKVQEGAIKIVSVFPPDSHKAIYNYVAVLKDSRNKKIAENFIAFLLSNRGNKILSKYGLGSSKLPRAVALAQEKPRIIIEAYYPFNEEHLFIKEYLLALSVKYKGQLKIDCVDFRSDEGYNRWRKTGLSCGGILINGKNKFRIGGAGQPREVEFIKAMDACWTKEDLEAVIEQELSSLSPITSTTKN